MRERLRRAGLRSISPVVDVTNYVMLELGQPMHAYDLAKLHGGITVRLARAGEALTLLDGRTINAEADVLLIADGQGPVGLAGIMGGERTAVSAGTADVFFESAFFAPQAVLGRARRFGLTTDASQRFERGVDPTQQARAIERALALLLPIAGGPAGPVVVTESALHLPQRAPVPLRRTQLERLLGVTVPDERVTVTLQRLQMKVVPQRGGLAGDTAALPLRHRHRGGSDRGSRAHRRLRGDPRDRRAGAAALSPALPEAQPSEAAVLQALAARGYQEAITLRVRRSGAAEHNSSRSAAALALSQSDRERPVGHARVAVAGTAARGARESAPPAGSHPSLRAWHAL